MGLLIACSAMVLGGEKRLNLQIGKVRTLWMKYFFSGIKAANDSIKKCTFSALCTGV